ncbi:MAG: hypothetical protein WKG00_24100 [Polyangiaceae bacterium]
MAPAPFTDSAAKQAPVSRAPRAREVRVVRVPLYGTVRADDAVRRRVDRWFQWPMTVLSLIFLALIGVEWLGADDGTLARVVDVGFAIIWTAFVTELLVKLAIADSRWQYLKKNWLDLVIVVVPLLRPLRVASSVAKMTRVVRLRGAAVKTGRAVLPAVIGLRATNAVMQRLGVQPRNRKAPEQMTRLELEDEVIRLRQDLDALIGPPSPGRGDLDSSVPAVAGEVVVIGTTEPAAVDAALGDRAP